MIILEAKQASKHFSGLKAVDNVDVEVHKGEILGIIGPNGAGKTTLFNLCAGSLRVTSGEIWLLEQNITNKNQEQIAALGLARTFQNIKLFAQMKVRENIAAGFHIHTKTNVFDAIFRTKRFHKDESFIEERTEQILKQLNMTQYGDTKASNLSYGLQRRVEIARAMALDPKILLLDEPAAGMNPNESIELLEFIKKLNADGYTIVVIEHDVKFIMNLCDRIIVLNYGKKICEGKPEEVSCNQDVQAAYFGAGLVAQQALNKEEPNA